MYREPTARTSILVNELIEYYFSNHLVQISVRDNGDLDILWFLCSGILFPITTISGTRLDHGDLAVCSCTDLLFKTDVFATVWVRNPTMASCRGSRGSLDTPEFP